jgi:hypothetical protein
VLDPDRLAADDRNRLQRRSASPYLLSEVGRLIDELPVDRVEPLEQRWRAGVLP